jgi:quercetin dioxygenase-like cupin family protein
MRSLDTLGLPAAPPWSDADLVELTIRLANEPAAADASGPAGAYGPAGASGPAPAGAYGPTNEPAPPEMGPLSGRVAHRGGGVFRSSTAPADRGDRDFRPSTAPGPGDPAWSVPLLVTPEVEAWLLGWPAGLVTTAHDHGRATVAVTVVEGGLSEECLDPTIWTTGRRTTWRAGASTLFPAGHVHVLGAAGDRPAVAVHAWSGPVRSGGRGAGGLALGRAGAGGRGPGRGRGPAEPVGVGRGRGGGGCLAGHPAHGALDLGHVGDRVAG